MFSPPSIACSCKAVRCHQCLKCSRCGCNHNGETPSRVVNRKRGERGEDKKWTKKAKRRAVDKSRPGVFEESPLDAPRDYVLYSSFPSSNPAVTPAFKCTSVADILRVFGLDGDVDETYGQKPSVIARQDPETWNHHDTRGVRTTKTIIREIFRRVCSIFCVNSAESESVLYDSLVRSELTEPSEVEKTLLSAVGDCYIAAKRGSIEKRVLRAALCTFPRSKMRVLFENSPSFSLSTHGFRTGLEDLRSLQMGLPIESMSRGLQRYSADSICHAVKFILSGANVAFLSWGSKRVKLDGKWEVLPAMIRRQTRTRLHASYIENTPVTHKSLSRSTFFRIASQITAGDLQMRTAVDYVVGFLVNDSMALVKRIISDTKDMDAEKVEGLLSDVEVVKAYLKYGFDTRVKDAKPCLLHDVVYALDPTSSSQSVPVCSDCSKVFSFFDGVQATLVENGAPSSAIEMVEEATKKARLYLGHRLRVLNQQAAIAKLTDDMRQKTLDEMETTEAIVLIDFKMKLDPLYHREKTVEHYGKRGMSWHGALIQFCEFSPGGPGESPEIIEQKLYYDHLSDGDNKQDRECVLSMVEAVLIRLRKDVPTVRRIVLQSDNAACYQNMLLLVLLPYLSAAHGKEIARFIHSETQDGKSILDAHFARAMQALITFVKAGHDCATPTQTVIGLSSNGGVPNTVVELVDHDRARLKTIMEAGAALEKQIKRHLTRANDVFFTYHCPQNRTPQSHEFGSCPPFTLTIFEYSGVGSGLSLLCNPATGQCTVTSENWLRVNESEYNTVILSLEEEHGEADVDHNLEEDDSEDEDLTQHTNDVVEMAMAVGRVTGVTIRTQGQLRRRTTRPRMSRTPADSTNATHHDVDIVSQATRMALDMHLAGEIFAQDVGGRYRISNETDGSNCDRADYSPGWAVRPKRGHMYGRRYIADFRSIIKDLFERGAREKSNKMGPARMLEELHKRVPERYDFPTEHEIRVEISRLNQIVQRTRPEPPPIAPDDAPQTAKDNSMDRHDRVSVAGGANVMVPDPSPRKASEVGADRTRGNHSQSKEFALFFAKLLQADGSTKTKVALSRFKQRYPESGLTDQQIKTKFSNTKSGKIKTNVASADTRHSHVVHNTPAVV